MLGTPDDPAFLRRANDALIELARKDAEDKGNPDPIKTVDYRGITGYKAGSGGFGILEGTLVIGNEGDTLKGVIDRALDKSGKSIVDDSEWKARRAQAASDALAWGMVRLV